MDIVDFDSWILDYDWKEDAVEIRAKARRLMEFLQKEHSKITDQ